MLKKRAKQKDWFPVLDRQPSLHPRAALIASLDDDRGAG
jgi:hypothetical protein